MTCAATLDAQDATETDTTLIPLFLALLMACRLGEKCRKSKRLHYDYQLVCRLLFSSNQSQSAMSWVPWHLALSLLPPAAADLLRDERKQRELRVELAASASVYGRLLLLWGFRAVQARAFAPFAVAMRLFPR